MPESGCNHPGTLAAICVYGSGLVLCRHCWEAIDPSPRPAHQPHKRLVADLVEKNPAAPAASSSPSGRALPEEFEVPLLLRYDLRYLRGFGKFIILSFLLSAVFYALLLSLLT